MLSSPGLRHSAACPLRCLDFVLSLLTEDKKTLALHVIKYSYNNRKTIAKTQRAYNVPDLVLSVCIYSYLVFIANLKNLPFLNPFYRLRNKGVQS